MKSSQESTEKKVNGWKWAFITFVLIVIGFIVYLLFLIRPYSVEQSEGNQTSVVQEELNLTTSVSKQDAQVIINEYLSESIGEDFEQYEVVLTDQLEVHGVVEILTINAPFVLSFDVFALEDGNLQLRGQTVELANFSLPVGAVMNLFARQVDLPTFVEVNGNNQMITIYLDELMQENAFQLSINQIDLENDFIEFNLGFNKELLTEQID